MSIRPVVMHAISYFDDIELTPDEVLVVWGAMRGNLAARIRHILDNRDDQHTWGDRHGEWVSVERIRAEIDK